jgi:3-deoxy-7-phosphoheptulonate synthase
MPKSTDDLRIKEIRELRTPEDVIREFPRTDAATKTVISARHALHNIIHGHDDRLAVVVGPCSIHDPKAALEYARRLADIRDRLERQPRDRHARLFREAAHHGGLEGPDQRSQS